MLEAVPLEAGDTFIHFSYSFAYGLAGRLALQVYLGTIGRDKVGFGVAGTGSDGKPVYIGGIRGLVERNTMRYYLAIEAFLGAVSAPPQERLERRLRDWFAASERYPRQLHEDGAGGVSRHEAQGVSAATIRTPGAGGLIWQLLRKRRTIACSKRCRYPKAATAAVRRATAVQYDSGRRFDSLSDCRFGLAQRHGGVRECTKQADH